MFGNAFCFILGAVMASACWWAYVRVLPGVKSDLVDVANDAKKVVGK